MRGNFFRQFSSIFAVFAMVLQWSSSVKSSQKAARFVRLQEEKARKVCGLIERFFLTPHPAQYAPPSPTFKFCGVILTLSKGEGFLFVSVWFLSSSVGFAATFSLWRRCRRTPTEEDKTEIKQLKKPSPLDNARNCSTT